MLRATNVVLSAWLLYQAWTLLSNAEIGDLYFAIPQGAVGVLLAILVLLRQPPSDVRLGMPVLVAAIVSNGHFALFGAGQPTSAMTAIVGTVLLDGAVFLAAYAHLVLGRSFSILPAVREIRTHGPYRVIRHPIYLALILTDLGLALSWPNLRNVALAAAGVVAHVVRVLQEEAMWLRRSNYRQYRRRTRYRLIPFVF